MTTKNDLRRNMLMWIGEGRSPHLLPGATTDQIQAMLAELQSSPAAVRWSRPHWGYVLTDLGERELRPQPKPVPEVDFAGFVPEPLRLPAPLTSPVEQHPIDADEDDPAITGCASIRHHHGPYPVEPHELDPEVLAEWEKRFLEAIDEPTTHLVSVAPGLQWLNQDARCRVCGCTDEDCVLCVQVTGAPCYWVEPDLCSACAPPAEEEEPAGLWREVLSIVGESCRLLGRFVRALFCLGLAFGGLLAFVVAATAVLR